MELNNQNNHWYALLDDIVKDLRGFLIFSAIICAKFGIKAIILCSIIGLVNLIVSFIMWKKTVFSVKEGVFNYTTGLINIKSLNISINKISTVDLGQNIFQRIFNVYRVKIDSGSVSSTDTEIDIILKKDIAFKLRNILSYSKEHYKIPTEKESEDLFKVSNKELFLYAITKNNLFFGIGMLFAINEFLDKIGNILDVKVCKTIQSKINFSYLDNISIIYMIYLGCIFIVVFLIISIIVSIIVTIIKFYNFHVYKKENNLIIKYGLFNKKQYSFPIESIRAIKLKQGLIKQKLNLYKIEICTVGYGDESGEEALLYPLANKNKLLKLFKNLMPEFKFEENLKKASKNALLKYIFIPTVISIILCSIVTYINIKFTPVFILVFIVIISRYLSYKNVGINFNDKILIATCDGFGKTTTIVKMESIQSISISSNYLQRIKKLCTYKISFYSNKIGDIIILKHLNCDYFRELENNIKF